MTSHNPMAQHWSATALALLFVFCGLLAPSSVVVAAPFSAPSAASGDTLSLALTNGSSFTYGGNSSSTVPEFTATVVFAAKPTLNWFMQVIVHLSGSQTTLGSVNSPTISSDGLTYTFQISGLGTVIPVGDYTAFATFLDVKTPNPNVTLQSGSVSFTITKATPSLSCMLNVSSLIVSPGQTVTVSMSPSLSNSTATVDWQNATYTVAFVGPATVTSANLKPDSNDAVTVQLPSQLGRYTTQSTFNGTANFTSATATCNQEILVSQRDKIGTVDLYSNPTTVVAGQSLHFYVVFHPAAGLPVPTGYFNVDLGTRYTSTAVQIGSNGATLVQIAAIPSAAGVDAVHIDYQGDEYYDAARVNFPLTNPPIPSSGGGSGGSSGQGSSPTATTQPGASGTPTTTSTATGSGAVPISGAHAMQTDPARPPQSGAPVWPLVIAAVALWQLLGGAGVVSVVRRRMRSAVPIQ